MDKILAQYSVKTAGGTDTQIVIPILKVIGIHVELVVVGVPVGIDETGAHPSLALCFPRSHGN